MADQHHKGRSGRGIAEQPTRPVDIDALVDPMGDIGEGLEPTHEVIGDTTGDVEDRAEDGLVDGDGPTILTPLDERRPEVSEPEIREPKTRAPERGGFEGSDAFSSRDPSMTQTGSFGEPDTIEGGFELPVAEAILIDPAGADPVDVDQTSDLEVADPGGQAPRPYPGGQPTSPYTGADEPTRALDADRLVRPAPPLEPTSSVPWPQTPAVALLAPRDMLGARYLIHALVSDRGPCRRYRAQMLNEHPVIVRTYARPDAVRHRPEWQALCEAFQAGAALPELLETEGVVPLIDLFEDAKHGPVVVTAVLDGGTLAEAAAQPAGKRGAWLAACFERVAGVLARAHAQGVTVGRFTPADIFLDRDGAPYLDLSVAAFGDALDVRDPSTEAEGPPEGARPSPEGDLWWLGQSMAACLPPALEPGADILSAVAQDCIEGSPRPTAAEVSRRLRAARPAPVHREPPRRWSTAFLLGLGIVVALTTGWVAGGGWTVFSAPAPDASSEARSTPPLEARSKATLSAGEAAVARGEYLDAGQLYVQRLQEGPDDEVKTAFERLRKSRSYRRALKKVKMRLANADTFSAEVRRDIDTLRALEPESLVLKHWLGRLAEMEGDGQ